MNLNHLADGTPVLPSAEDAIARALGFTSAAALNGAQERWCRDIERINGGQTPATGYTARVRAAQRRAAERKAS